MKHHVHRRPASAEATMGLWVDAGGEGLQAGKGHPGEDLPDDAKKEYPTIAIAVTSIVLVLIQSDDVRGAQ